LKWEAECDPLRNHRVVLFHHDLLPLQDLVPLGDAKEIKAGGESLPIDPHPSVPGRVRERGYRSLEPSFKSFTKQKRSDKPERIYNR
jgi:hypothetical protein